MKRLVLPENERPGAWLDEWEEAYDAAHPPEATHAPVKTLSANPLRPSRLADLVGQSHLKALLARVISAAQLRNKPLDHILLSGPSGVGKTTLAYAIACEMGTSFYACEAPVSHQTLLELRTVMQDGDVLFIDEVAQQAIMERRGKDTSTQPEVLYQVLEDRTIISGTGVLPFPAITVIGATTDEGRLPIPLLNRFPLRPQIEPYSIDDLADIALSNAVALGVPMDLDAAYVFARASRGVPRQINSYVRNAESLLLPGQTIDDPLAVEVVEQLNRTTLDGLTMTMQRILGFLYQHGRHVRRDGAVEYRASATAIATATGRDRDVRALYRDEGWLIQGGLLTIRSNGRALTDAGVMRAAQLLGATP